MEERVKIRGGGWTIATAVVAATLYALALRSDVYEATSPHWLTWHVALRKAYSIGAFFIVAFLFRRALAEHGAMRSPVTRCIVVTTLYSAAIEVGQFAVGGREGLGWNVFDTLCGAAGGALATADGWLWPRAAFTRPRVRERRPR
jgi:hypothetical protein